MLRRLRGARQYVSAILRAGFSLGIVAAGDKKLKIAQFLHLRPGKSDRVELPLTELLLPAEDPSRVTFLFRFLDSALGLVEHGEAGVSQDIVVIDFNESLRRCNRLLYPPAIEQGHTQPMEGILIVRIDLQGFVVVVDRFVQLVV